MKKLNLIAIFIILFFGSKGQSLLYEHTYSYDAPDNYILPVQLLLTDGDTLLESVQERIPVDTSNYYRCWHTYNLINKTNGQPITSYQFDAPNYYGIIGTKTIMAGKGYVMITVFGNPPDSDLFGITYLDRNFNVIWSKIYHPPGGFFPLINIAESYDGKILIVGENRITNEMGQGIIMELDLLGNITKSKKIYCNLSNFCFSHTIKSSAIDTSYVVVSQDSGHTSILKFDHNLNVKWAKRIRVDWDQYQLPVNFSCQINSSGDIYVVGNMDVYATHTGNDPGIMKLTKDGDMQWFKCFDTPYFGESYASALVNNDDILLSYHGQTVTGLGVYNGKAPGTMLINANGNIAYHQLYLFYHNQCQAAGIVVDSNCTYYLSIENRDTLFDESSMIIKNQVADYTNLCNVYTNDSISVIDVNYWEDNCGTTADIAITGEDVMLVKAVKQRVNQAICSINQSVFNCNNIPDNIAEQPIDKAYKTINNISLNSKVSLFDMAGRLVYYTDNYSGNWQNKELQPGFYIFKAQEVAGKLYTGKFAIIY